MADKPMVPTDIQQVHSTEPDGQGGYHKQWTVHFTTPSGVRTNVQIPATEYTKENAAAQMAHEMGHIEAVQSLEGQPLDTTPASAGGTTA
jgi:hypothetical protein